MEGKATKKTLQNLINLNQGEILLTLFYPLLRLSFDLFYRPRGVQVHEKNKGKQMEYTFTPKLDPRLFRKKWMFSDQLDLRRSKHHWCPSIRSVSIRDKGKRNSFYKD